MILVIPKTIAIIVGTTLNFKSIFKNAFFVYKFLTLYGYSDKIIMVLTNE